MPSRYPLAPLVGIRERREQSAAASVARSEAEVRRADRARLESAQRVDEFVRWRKEEEERRWVRFLARTSVLKEVEEFRDSLALLAREQTLLESKLAAAEEQLRLAKERLDDARQAHLNALRKLEKLKEHRKEWERETRAEELRKSDMELEDFHRRKCEVDFTEDLEFDL